MLAFRTARALVDRLRVVFSAQVQLWDSAQRGLEPWRAEGPLRWSGRRLDGAAAPDLGPHAPDHAADHDQQQRS